MTIGLKAKHNQAAAIVAALSTEEKARLCSGRNFWHLESVAEFDVPEIMVTDGPHGLRKQQRAADHVGLHASVPATCFPTASALASSWDEDLLVEVGQALGRECIAENVTVLLGPGMNIKRHPLCGRNFEYFSEDPLLNGRMAAALVHGVQSQGVGTSIKHFAVNNQEAGRMIVDAIVDERTLRELYLAGFEYVVKAVQPWTVMCAYNRVNGTYASEHDWLLNQVLRDEWGFEGLVVTDWGAANDRALGVASGLDLEMPGSGGVNDSRVHAAVQAGTLSEAELDRAVTRNVALSLLGADVHGAETALDLREHHDLACRAAAASCVLLKNTAAPDGEAVLPLRRNEHVAVIGAFAKHPRYQGAGSSQVNPTQLDNAWDAIAAMAAKSVYRPGYEHKRSEPDQGLIDAAVATARACDVAVVVVGLPAIYESEGFDRTDLELPAQHNALIEAVCAVNPRTVVVLCNGAPVAMPWVDEPAAIVEAYLGGQGGGSGLAAVLFGAVNPSGKLAESFPERLEDLPANSWFPGEHRQVQYREGLYVGYRYFDSAAAQVLFPFGHGLSYTTFAFGDPQLAADVFQQGGELEVVLPLANTGGTAGAEVVQLYVHRSDGAVYRPEQELKGFRKVHLDPGTGGEVRFRLTDDTFKVWDADAGGWAIEPGVYQLRFGASSRDIRQAVHVTVHSSHTLTSDDDARPQLARAAALGEPHGLAMPDDRFARLLRRAVPAPEASRPYHLNSSIAEIGESWLGARFKQRIVAGFVRNMGSGGTDETLEKMFEEMANNMPLRSLVLFSRGKTGFDDIAMMLALLNHRYGEALKLWWQARTAR